MTKVWVYRGNFGTINIRTEFPGTNITSLHVNDNEASALLEGLRRVLSGETEYEVNIP